MAALDNLPADIVIEILQYLDHRSLKSLRLTSSAFQDNVSRKKDTLTGQALERIAEPFSSRLDPPPAL